MWNLLSSKKNRRRNRESNRLSARPWARDIEALESRTLLTVPPGFTETRVATGLAQPVSMAFAPDGRSFITEKTGNVRVMTASGQLLPTPFVQLAVDAQGERGVLGVEFDPDFATNGHVFIYYTSTDGTIHNRLSRFTAADANPGDGIYTPGNTAAPGSEFQLINFDPLSSIYHNAGNMHFGPDGKLYVAVGDNVRGVLSQQLTNLWGKIIRINRDGTIPTDNPFYNQTTGINRAIWALGLRNAFTFAFQPGTGVMYINEVGNSAWEEINQGVAGGNYGWPQTEGAFDPGQFPNFTNPIYTYANNRVCNAITGALFYNPAGGGSQLPAQYVGKYFFGDLCGGHDAGTANGWIKTFDPVTKTVADFGANIQRPVDFDIGPDGSLYYLSNSRPGVAGHVYRVAPAGAASDLNITVPPDDVTASVGREAAFSVVAQGSGTITYQWQRNGVNIPGATEPTYRIVPVTMADSGALFRVIVSDGSRALTSADATLTVVNNQPPVATITLPVTGTTFAGGQTIQFAGTATDPEDGTLGPEAFTWRVDYLTGEVERAAMPDTTGIRAGQFTTESETPFTSTRVRYRVVLTVRDSAGLESTASVDLSPLIGTINLATEPAGRGLSVTLDGETLRGAVTDEGVVGVERVLAAPATQTVNGVTYQFASWSDGVVQGTRAVTTGSQPATFTAVYQPADDGTGNPADADLAAAVAVPPAASLLTGGKGKVTVRVTNQGGARVAGPLAFAIIASPDGFLDPDDPVVATVTRPVKLLPGRSRNVKLNFTVSSSVPEGSYLLLVRPDAAGAVTETVEFNNVAATAAPVTIAPPFSDLAGSIGVVRVAGLAPRRITTTLLLQNLGNSTYTGPVTVTLLASTDATFDSTDMLLTTLPARSVKIRAGGRKSLRLRTNLPAMPAGTYHLVARIVPTGSPADTNASNNDIVGSGTFAVA